jgi:hypothetical protein
LEPGTSFFKELMAKGDNTGLIVALGAGALYFMTRSQAPGTGNPLSNIVNSLIPTTAPVTPQITNQQQAASPLMVQMPDGSFVPYQSSSTAAATTGLIAINSGIAQPVPGGSVDIISNYDTLVSENPNLGNPGYVMTAEENAQYLLNYLDLRQWDYSYGPAFQGPPLKGQSIAQAAQWHWQNHGCAEKRVFCILEPPSMIPYAGAQPTKHTSAFGEVLKIATVVAGSAIEIASAGTATAIVAPATAAALAAESAIKGTTDAPALSSLDSEILFTGAGILIDILPYYNQAAKKSVKLINTKLHLLLNQYSNG